MDNPYVAFRISSHPDGIDYTQIRGVENVMVSDMEFDISKVMAEHGRTVRRVYVSNGCMTADAYPTVPEGVSLNAILLEDGVISESGMRWLTESGMLASPELDTLCLCFAVPCDPLRVLPSIRAENLCDLRLDGVFFGDERRTGELFSMIARLPNLVALEFSGEPHGDPSEFAIRLPPSLEGIRIKGCKALSNAVVKWVLDRGMKVQHLDCDRCSAAENMTDREYFRHPRLQQIVFKGIALKKTTRWEATKGKLSWLMVAFCRSPAMRRIPQSILMLVYQAGADDYFFWTI